MAKLVVIQRAIGTATDASILRMILDAQERLLKLQIAEAWTFG
jgi:hypothetical protein